MGPPSRKAQNWIREEGVPRFTFISFFSPYSAYTTSLRTNQHSEKVKYRIIIIQRRVGYNIFFVKIRLLSHLSSSSSVSSSSSSSKKAPIFFLALCFLCIPRVVSSHEVNKIDPVQSRRWRRSPLCHAPYWKRQNQKRKKRKVDSDKHETSQRRYREYVKQISWTCDNEKEACQST